MFSHCIDNNLIKVLRNICAFINQKLPQTLCTVIPGCPLFVSINQEECVWMGIWCIGTKSRVNFPLGLELVKIKHRCNDIQLFNVFLLCKFDFFFRCERWQRVLWGKKKPKISRHLKKILSSLPPHQNVRFIWERELQQARDTEMNDSRIQLILKGIFICINISQEETLPWSWSENFVSNYH